MSYCGVTRKNARFAGIFWVMFLLLLSFSLDIYAAPAVIIENFSDSPDPFSPDADSINDNTVISAVVSAKDFNTKKPLTLNWAVVVRDTGGKTAAKFRQTNISIENNGQAAVSWVWTGRNDKNKVVPAGLYNYRITAAIKGQNSPPVSGEITVEAVPEPCITISGVSDWPDPFSPNNDAIEDTTLIEAVIAVSGFDSLVKHKQRILLKWNLVIKDFQDKVIRKYADTRQVENNSNIEVFITWDGRNAGRKTVTDGLYYYEFSAKAKKIEAQPQSGEVTVKTRSLLSVSVSPDFWHIGEFPLSGVVTMNEENKITVTNDGQAKQSYSLQLINPVSWQDSQDFVGSNTYILNAAFSSDANNIVWNETNHALSTIATLCSTTKFAGNQTGVEVAPGEQRNLWLQFKAPDSTTVDGEQEIKVIINAEMP